MIFRFKGVFGLREFGVRVFIIAAHTIEITFVCFAFVVPFMFVVVVLCVCACVRGCVCECGCMCVLSCIYIFILCSC